MRNKNPLNLHKSLPCMSWSPKNLYNVWRRTVGPESEDLTFKATTEQTLFQQRWRSKAAVRAYHGEYIPEKVFKRWYLPDTIPDVRPRRQVIGDDKTDLEHYAKRKTRVKEQEKKLEEEIEKKGLAPVGSLMFREVERRMDVFLFRCCFVHSVYEARRLIIHGYVKLNGKKHSHANTRLAPGDMVSVDPTAIRFLKTPYGAMERITGPVPKTAKPAAQSEASESDAAKSEEDQTTKSEETEATKGEDAATKAVAKTEEPYVPYYKRPPTPFYLPEYASPWLFIPAYIEVSFKTCSAIYVRHPTARPGYSEIPTPYDADGAVIRYAWEWYVQRRPRMRSQSQRARMPMDRVVELEKSLNKDRRAFTFSKELYEKSKISWRHELPQGFNAEEWLKTHANRRWVQYWAKKQEKLRSSQPAKRVRA
uniref:RNA-binding S4 domain-containing protein n=1 Tax=Psilocybe cubensis TaxID=181762 RepID=A0A8H8CI16_PSICU